MRIPRSSMWSCLLTLTLPLALLAYASNAHAGEDAKGNAKDGQGGSAATLQMTCPITKMAINKKYFVDGAGQRIYACCPGCLPVIKKDPEAALAKLQRMGQYAESLQTTCPIMKLAINKKLFVEYEGRRLYVCCPPCLGKVKADPATYAARIAQAVAARKPGAPAPKAMPKDAASADAMKSEKERGAKQADTAAKAKKAAAATKEGAKAMYACPMNCVKPTGAPGACPTCGMKLKPQDDAAANGAKAGHGGKHH